MAPVNPDESLRRWFAGLVETSFHEQVGVCDPGLLDYLTDLLTEFIHVERINRIRDAGGRRSEEVADLLAAADTGPLAEDAEARRRVHRHIGDFTLFWTGVYPENIRRIHRRHTRDDLLSYFEQGKRSYLIASDLSTDNTEPPAQLLYTLSEQFEYCVYGLGLVRKGWEEGDPSGEPHLWKG